MFFHRKELQYHAKPESPDPVFAKQVQELIGGQFGEMSVAMQYLFQGWNTRGNEKYRDLLMDTGSQELGHIEMLATLVARLLEGAPVYEQEKAAADPVVGAIMGGMNPQHAIVHGLGASPKDSNGVPWNSGYIISSGNLLADFRANVNAESQGRLQVARLYSMTDDRGVKDLFSFLIARDTMHQNQWLAAIKEMEAKEGVIVPSTLPPEWEAKEHSHVLYTNPETSTASQLDFLNHPAPDGGTFTVEAAKPFGEAPMLKPAPPQAHNTLPGEND
ncbi:manganese catalase family protein [Planococcus sp. CAU13]|uniref:manganese catalase family protein n=1 Tax=Planococcus sp. CAU13 TaxID=1541197 RepID=UPI00052FE14C|nr:manganese catalase family protein [Planococcus sp. CAU13]